MVRIFRSGLVILVLLVGAIGAPSAPTRPFDEFGDINCEDEMARLDNIAVQLMAEPSTRGVIIVYGGRRFRGRLPKRGEAAARAARLKPYLVQRRGVPSDRVLVVDGGYREKWEVAIWIVPPGANIPTPEPKVPLKAIKFRKGKANPREFRCNI